jgi:predicted transcriptional regulator
VAEDEGTQFGGDLNPDQGQELSDLLHHLGLDERPARVVGFLAVHADGRSSEIEEALDMRQPEVSQATKSLRERGWVEAVPEKTPGKGRPVNNYRLAVPLADVAGEVEARRREEINQQLDRLDRLREIVEGAPEVPAEPDAEAGTPEGATPEGRR